jgi:hypothetical protein
MPGLGTLINMAAVIAGAAAGALVGNRLPTRTRETVMDGLGLLTLILGISLALETQNFLIVMGSVLLGGLTGELLGIERGLEGLGDYFQRRFASPSSSVSAGFVTASLVFCVGPMAVLGSIEDGLHGNVDILVVKAILDGFASLAFAATLGWGVGLSALSLFVYQGAITLAAGSVEQVLTDGMITEMTATGGVLILAIALRLMSLRSVRVGNLLPALLYAPLLVGVVARF